MLWESGCVSGKTLEIMNTQRRSAYLWVGLEQAGMFSFSCEEGQVGGGLFYPDCFSCVLQSLSGWCIPILLTTTSLPPYHKPLFELTVY